MGFYQYRKEQLLHAGVDEVWDFISSPSNLKEITPEYMGFDITSENMPEKMYRGMIISYMVRPLFGIKVTWVTEITEIAEKKFFIDQQRIGPYAFWHHQHFIEPLGEKVLMKDIVSYKPPFGILGSIANMLVIRKKIKEIFDYREMVLNSRFPEIQF
ncbi:MAG: SRPBCC family protein [Bacteroidia bacterium]|nr:SRPBCC family protein [Bacteroidia bacterium]